MSGDKPVFTMIGDADAAACVDGVCAVPAVAALESEEAATAAP
ncbi:MULTISPECIES: hypothetical protein [unclassified Cryobacterium]|nr:MULTISPECIES: hypothetical protein [unclassified Cryobacterium]